MKIASLLHNGYAMHEFILCQDLEPFPELDCFEQFRVVQQKVCKSYSPKDHLLNVTFAMSAFNLKTVLSFTLL